MTKRVATTIVLSVRLPLPPGVKVNAAIASVQQLLRDHRPFESFSKQIIIKLSSRETVYL
jgi:hypothetical protein